MLDRFFVDSPIESSEVQLVGDEAHHMLRVLRMNVGDATKLFDGTGAEFDAILLSTSAHTAKLKILHSCVVDRELPGQLVLGVALPKGDRQKTLVEKAVELGVHRLIPLVTERSVAKFTQGAESRLTRAVKEASKQCGRNKLMEIGEPKRLQDLLAEAVEFDLRVVAHPTGNSLNVESSFQRVIALIGPEGGLSDQEIAVAKELDWNIVQLGLRILRVETAAIFAAAVLGQRMESTGP